MNKGLYKHSVHSDIIFWYEIWENSSKNFGRSIKIENPRKDLDIWEWWNCDNDLRYLVGAECLAQW